MSGEKKSELNQKLKCLNLQTKKSSKIKTKICNYLNLPRKERLLLRKKRYNLNSKIIRDKRIICKKDCRDFKNQDETKINGRCSADKKKLCIRFNNRKDDSTTYSVIIKKRPWENDKKCQAQIYQCYCKELKNKKLKQPGTGLNSGKSLAYPDEFTLKLNDKVDFNGQSLQLLKVDNTFYRRRWEKFLKIFPLQNLSSKENGPTQYNKRQSLQIFKLNSESLTGQFLKTFQIKYHASLSLTGRNILTSFTNKYIYYAIDDILYLLNSNIIERDNLLSILYSSMLSLQNDFSINFFDIWVDSVYLNDNSQTNRFYDKKSEYLNRSTVTNITLKLHYFTRTPIKKSEVIW